MRRSSQLRTVIGTSAALALACGNLAYADVVKNSVTANGMGPGGQVEVAAGTEAVVPYWIEGTGAGGDANCDAADGSPAYLTINVPAGVVATPARLTFTSCDTRQEVSFSAASGKHSVPAVTVTDTAGSYSEASTAFTLNVAAASTSTGSTPVNTGPTVGEITGSATAPEGSAGTYSVSASDPDNDTLTYLWSVTSGAAQIDGAGDGASASVRFLDGPSAVGLSVTVSDGQGHSVTRTFAASATNVAPTISGFAFVGVPAVACLGSNQVTLGFSAADPADETRDPLTGTVTWGDGTTSPVSGRTVSLPHGYAAGSYTGSVSISDGDEGTATAGGPGAGSVSLLYSTGAGILQPINYTGPRSSFKLGSTIPVKIKVLDCAGAAVSTSGPTVALTKMDATPDGTAVEDVLSTVPDQGTSMRFTGAPDLQWIYNLGTKNLTTGDFRITLTSPVIAPVNAFFSIKK